MLIGTKYETDIELVFIHLDEITPTCYLKPHSNKKIIHYRRAPTSSIAQTVHERNQFKFQ